MKCLQSHSLTHMYLLENDMIGKIFISNLHDIVGLKKIFCVLGSTSEQTCK